MNVGDEIVEKFAVNGRAKKKLTPDEVFAKYEHLRITTLRPEPQPEPIITIHGIPILTRGSIAGITAPVKGGKGAFLTSLASGAIATSNGYDGCADIEIVSNTDSKAVLLFDPEQSKRWQWLAYYNSILKRAHYTKEPPFLYAYNQTQIPQKDRMEHFESICEAAHQRHGGIHFVAIDGVAKYARSINDEAEAEEIIQQLQTIAGKYDTGIILVIHLNPGTKKERGHIGTIFTQACENVLEVEKEGDVSIIKDKHLRGGFSSDFAPIHLQYDKTKGYHVFLNSKKEDNNSPSALKELAGFIFKQPRKYSDAVSLIKDYEACSLPTAKRRIKEMTDTGLLDRSEDHGGIIYTLKSIEDEKTPF